MATGQVGEVWVAGGAALFTSGNIREGGGGGGGRSVRGSQAASKDPPRGFPKGTFHILSRKSDLKGLACEAYRHLMVK